MRESLKTLRAILPRAHGALPVVVVGALILLFTAGCASMADPQGAELPWTGREAWELTPALPGGMMQQ